MQKPTSRIIPVPAAKADTYNAALAKSQNVIGSRIAAARQAKGCSLRELTELLHARGIDLEYQAAHKWEKGLTVPNAYQLLAVCDALEIPDGLAYFLDRGPGLNTEGLRRLAEYRDDLLATGKYLPAPSVEKTPIRYVEMPVSTLAVSAGTGEFLDEENIVMMRFPETDVPAGADFALRVSGDSMEPVYRDHQLVWVQICNALRPGEVGIFVLDGEGFLKAYGEQTPAPEVIDDYVDSSGFVHLQPVLLSYNKAYAPRVVLPGSQFKICGRVLN